MIDSLSRDAVPAISAAQMAEVDRLMEQHYAIDLARMMENAGRALARLAREVFVRDETPGSVAVLAGTGGNGGGALVAARHLANWGLSVQVTLSGGADRLTPVPARQFEILRNMDISVAEAVTPAPSLIIDGLIGYCLKGAPRGRTEVLINWANGQTAPVLSLDIPSGLDATNGTVFDPAIRAAATMTVALPKTGLLSASAEACVGDLYLADISVPPALYAGRTLGLDVGPLFANGEILRLV